MRKTFRECVYNAIKQVEADPAYTAATGHIKLNEILAQNLEKSDCQYTISKESVAILENQCRYRHLRNGKPVTYYGNYQDEIIAIKCATLIVALFGSIMTIGCGYSLLSTTSIQVVGMFGAGFVLTLACSAIAYYGGSEKALNDICAELTKPLRNDLGQEIPAAYTVR